MSKEKRNINFPRKITLLSRVVLPPETKGPPFVTGCNSNRDKRAKICLQGIPRECLFCHGAYYEP
jgi:hypothetical protein